MEKLVRKARDGDKDAFVELIHIIEKDLYNIAQIKINNIEDINDVIQETMLKAFKSLKSLNEPKYFKTWITKILINECNKFYIKKFKHIALLDKIIKNKDDNELDLVINEIEYKMDYNTIMKKLNSKKKTVIILYFYNRFSKKEIADILNISINTVKTRLRRAEEKIKELRKGDKYE